MNFKLKTCQEEYAQDSKINEKDIREMKKWVDEQPHLPNVKEYMLIQCYHVSDYNIENAKKLVDRLYSFKNIAPELFTGQDYGPPMYQHTFHDVAYYFVMPQLTSEGYRIIFLGLKDFDPSKFDYTIDLVMKVRGYFSTVLELGTCSGYIAIYDMQGMSLGHLRSFSLLLSNKILRFVQEAVPVKIKKIHLINMQMIARKLLAMVRPFINKELQEMIYTYSDMQKFYEAVGKENLPKDLGGTSPYTKNELNEVSRAKMEAFSEAVIEELSLKTEEKLRKKEKKCK